MKTVLRVEVRETEASDAYKAGQMVGMFVPILLSLVGAFWCGAILARPNVNRKGVGALLTVFAGWTLALLLTLAQKAASGGAGFAFAIAGVVGVTILAGVCLAI